MLTLIKSAAPHLSVAYKSREVGLSNELSDLRSHVAKMNDQINQLKNAINARSIRLYINGEQTWIEVNDIVLCRASGNYTYILIRQRANETISYCEVMISKTLKKIVQMIADNRFVRCHQSFVLNRSFVTSVTSRDIRLVTGDVIPVSRRQRNTVKEFFLA